MCFPRFVTAVILIFVFGVTGILSCGTSEEEARKFPVASTSTLIEADSLRFFRLANGISVYLQEEHSHNQIAVEVLYPVGPIHEADGKPQISLLLPYLLVYSPSKSFKENEAFDKILEVGRVNASIAGDFTHYDYIVNSDKLDLVLQVEAERMTSSVFTEDLLNKYAQKCVEDVRLLMNNPRGSLIKYGMMAFNQAFNYRNTFVPVYSGTFDITIDELKRFHESYYRPNEMVLALIGDFDTEIVKSKIESYFGGMPSKPAASRKTKPVEGKLLAKWDIAADLIFFAFPGPYENFKERITLTMFGSYLNQYLSNASTLRESVKTAYCTNTVYPVHDLPFFVFLHPNAGHDLEDVRVSALLSIQQAIDGVSESLFMSMRMNLRNFIESSIFESQMNIRNIPHHQVIGQEALNVCIRHHLKEGLSDEEFFEVIDSMTFEDTKRILESRFVSERMVEIVLNKPSK